LSYRGTYRQQWGKAGHGMLVEEVAIGWILGYLEVTCSSFGKHMEKRHELDE